MNTCINYMYRSGGNYKAYGSVIVEGEGDTMEDFQRFCIDREWFVPETVGLNGLQSELGEWDETEDVDFHEFVSFERTEDAPTVDISISELYSRFRKAKDNWFPFRLTYS
jgi:hypothetical protein